VISPISSAASTWLSIDIATVSNWAGWPIAPAIGRGRCAGTIRRVGDSTDQRERVILDVVTQLLETEGYDAVQVRRIASLASVSLTTVYNRFGTREALIVRAVRGWMEANARVALPDPNPDLSAYENIQLITRLMLEPWTRHPTMLQAFVRASLGPGGDQLRGVGIDWVVPKVRAGLTAYDAAFLGDLRMVMEHVIWSTFTRLSAGEMDLDQVLDVWDRTLVRLLGEQRPAPEPAAPAASARSTRSANRRATASRPRSAARRT